MLTSGVNQRNPLVNKRFVDLQHIYVGGAVGKRRQKGSSQPNPLVHRAFGELVHSNVGNIDK